MPYKNPILLTSNVTFLCPACGWPMNMIKTEQPRQIVCSNKNCDQKQVAYWEPRFEAKLV